MAECPRNTICPFYQLTKADDPARAEQLRARYCLGNYSACARYAVAKALGQEQVPNTLFPHEHAEARRLLASG